MIFKKLILKKQISKIVKISKLQITLCCSLRLNLIYAYFIYLFILINEKNIESKVDSFRQKMCTN
jgi:hypothetical protein